MPTTVKRITLWRKELPNQKGALAQVLEPLAGAGANLRVVMSYVYPGEPGRAAVELWPVTGGAETAAQIAGLAPASIPCVLVEGDDQAGLGARYARTVANAGVNMDFVMAQTAGGSYSLVIGFATEQDASTAESALQAAARDADAAAKPVRRSVKKSTAPKRAAKKKAPKAKKKAAKKKRGK